MPDSTLDALTAATAATGGLYYGTQGGSDRKFTITAAGATLVEAANAAAQRTALSLASVQPFILEFKNVTVLTSGSPADVATVTLPSWCTRYIVSTAGSRFLAESLSGTLAAAGFMVRDASNGAGDALLQSNAVGPSSLTQTVTVTGAAAGSPITNQTIYLHQTSNSLNTGVVSMYLLITPLL